GRVFEGEMVVDGLYDGETLRNGTVTATGLRMARLKPWFDQADESLGEAILGFDYRGAVGTNPALFTGTGNIHLENAPIVKVPLLDQTYGLFSVLTSPIQRKGSGRLDTGF